MNNSLLTGWIIVCWEVCAASEHFKGFYIVPVTVVVWFSFAIFFYLIGSRDTDNTCREGETGMTNNKSLQWDRGRCVYTVDSHLSDALPVTF